MNIKSEDNLKYIIKEVSELLEEKYRLGDKEHEGDLMDMPEKQLVKEAIMEGIDQLTYLFTLYRKL